MIRIVELKRCGEYCPHFYRTPNKTFNFETDSFEFVAPRRYCLKVRKLIETTKGFPEFCPLKEGGNGMTEQWEKYEPSPIEFMHGILLDEFHKFRKQKTEHTTVGIDGLEFNGIVVRAKKATYEKYKALKLDNVILKSDLEEGGEK